MGKFQHIPDNANNSIPPYPKNCLKSSCNEKTGIVMMRVFNKNTNKTEVGSVGGHTGKATYAHKSNNQWVMHEPYDFIEWITRCGYCYQDDLKKSFKSAIDNCKKENNART